MRQQVPSQGPYQHTGHQQSLCPLCGRAEFQGKWKLLYNHWVCKKCSTGFANRRQFAYLVDMVLCYVIEFVSGFIVGSVMVYSGATQPEVQTVAHIVGIALLPLFLLKDGFGGHSPGKALMGVQVINSKTGWPAGFGASFKRNLITLIPVMPLVVAFLLINGKRIGDGWANTKVIWKMYAHHPIFAPEAGPSPVQQ